MATDNGDVRLSVAARSAIDPRIALITDDDSRKLLVAPLKQNGMTFDVFDSVDALLEAQRLSPAAVVLWADRDVPELVRSVGALTDRFAEIPIVAVCSSIERWGIRAALAAGSAGIVLRGEIETALCPCLDAVRTGQTCVPREHWRQVEPPALSTREKQILGLVVMGFTNGQIAQQLFLAESTVKSHLSSAFGKLGVRSRNEAVTVILDPERGLGMGILALGGEPLEPNEPAAR